MFSVSPFLGFSPFLCLCYVSVVCVFLCFWVSGFRVFYGFGFSGFVSFSLWRFSASVFSALCFPFVLLLHVFVACSSALPLVVLSRFVSGASAAC